MFILKLFHFVILLIANAGEDSNKRFALDKVVKQLMELKNQYRAPFTITHTCEINLFQKLLGWKTTPNLDFTNKNLQAHFIVIANASHGHLQKYGKTKTKRRGTALWVHSFCKLLGEISESLPNTFASGGGLCTQFGLCCSVRR